MISLDTISLPADLHWSDETSWFPVEQPEPERSLGGDLLVEPVSRSGGRPITLAGTENTAWVTYRTVQAIIALAAVPGKIMQLTLDDARIFNVMFRYHDGGPITSAPLFPATLELPFAPEDTHWIILRLMEVLP